MRVLSHIFTGGTFAVLVSLIACSPSVEKPASTKCKTAACKGGTTAAPSPSSSAALYQAPVPAGPVPGAAQPDARPQVPTPTGNKPQVPPPNFACRDLTRCCQRIRSSFERTACMGVVMVAKPDVCATAVIGYQILGCGHSPFSFGSNDDDGDGVPNWIDPDHYGFGKSNPYEGGGLTEYGGYSVEPYTPEGSYSPGWAEIDQGGTGYTDDSEPGGYTPPSDPPIYDDSEPGGYGGYTPPPGGYDDSEPGGYTPPDDGSDDGSDYDDGYWGY